MPGGWQGGPAGTIFADDQVVHGGRWSARIERHSNSPSNFSVLTKSIAMDFSGTTIKLSGFLRTEGASGFAGLWMREDGESPSLAIDNMQSRQLKGTTAWTEYSIELPVHPEGRRLICLDRRSACSDDVAYLRLSSVKAADAAHYIEQASGTKGLIVDIRNYPSESMVYVLGSLLVDNETAFARFTVCDLSNPGAFTGRSPCH